MNNCGTVNKTEVDGPAAGGPGPCQPEKAPKLGNIRCDIDWAQSGWKRVAPLRTTNHELIFNWSCICVDTLSSSASHRNLSRLLLFC